MFDLTDESDKPIPAWQSKIIAQVVKSLEPGTKEQLDAVFKIVAHYAVQLQSIQAQQAAIIEQLNAITETLKNGHERKRLNGSGAGHGDGEKAADPAAGNSGSDKGDGR